jgi:hypothetical protein
MVVTTSTQLQTEATALAKELMIVARRIVNMFEKLSKDKRYDAIVIEDFHRSLKADPSIMGQLKAIDIIIDVSYIDEMEKLINQ